MGNGVFRFFGGGGSAEEHDLRFRIVRLEKADDVHVFVQQQRNIDECEINGILIDNVE